VISRNTLWPWSTCARPDCSISCGPWPVTSRPPTRMRPERGLSSPLATLSTVDLPAPFGPTRHTTVAAGTRIVRPRSTIAARPYPAWTSSSSRRYSCVAPAPGVGSDTKVGLQDSRVGLHDGGGPLGDRPAPVEHDDVVGQAHDHVHVVLDDEERAPLRVELLHESPDAPDEGGVHAARGLVEHDRVRVAHEHARELEQLLLPVGQVARLDVLEVVDADAHEQRARLVDLLRVARPGEQLAHLRAPDRDEHVLEHGHAGEHAAELEAPPDPG